MKRSGGGAPPRQAGRRPHIVIVNPDQWRGDVLGHAGNPAAVTPNLDGLVRQDAVSFSRAFCQNPVCTPSRCSFMSGWYPHVRGHRTMHHMMKPDEPVLLKTLKNEGYFVWWAGKNDLVPADADLSDYCDIRYRPETAPMPGLHVDQSWRSGPDSSYYYSFLAGKLDIPEGRGNRGDGDWANIEGAIRMIAERPDDRPLCLYLALGYPHPPYGVEEPWYSLIRRELLPERRSGQIDWASKFGMLRGLRERLGLRGWSGEQWTELRSVYYGMCARVDHQLGLLVQALKDAGIYDDTALFFFSDHGDYTGDYDVVEKAQNTFEDPIVRVPFIVKPPSGFEVEPGVRDALVELVDFPATVEDMLQLTPSHTHFGRSLLPLIAGAAKEHRDAVFCEGGRLPDETHCREAEEGLDPEHLYYPRLSLQQEEGNAHTKAVMVRTAAYKYICRLHEQDELYDLTRDPQEKANVIGDDAYAVVLRQLKERLLAFYMETADAVPYSGDSRF